MSVGSQKTLGLGHERLKLVLLDEHDRTVAIDDVLLDELLGPESVRGLFRQRGVVLPAIDVDASKEVERTAELTTNEPKHGAADNGITDSFQ